MTQMLIDTLQNFMNTCCELCKTRNRKIYPLLV